MRQAVLFYTFIGIFIGTAILTFLGLAGALTIPPTQLNMLVGALLVEVAGAVVGLYRKTNFFDSTGADLAMSLGSAIEGFDQISDEIEGTIKNQPPDQTHVHRFLIRRAGEGVVAYERMKVIKAGELEKLPAPERDLIRTYEKSMRKLVKQWRSMKRGDTAQVDPRVREQNLNLIRDMKGDLVGILSFLQSHGIYLDDHYATVRHLVSTLPPA